MGDEIEVNEYVRTNNNYIRKVIAERLNGYLVDVSYYNEIIDDTTLGIIGKEDIKKHSKNLIDLIEVGDIVKDEYNKYEVAFVKDDKIYCNDYNLDDSLVTLREQDIKAILTKEQMEDNCYKVGGE